MKVYSDKSLISLYELAASSPRQRAHLNLHASYDEKVQRLFIALQKGSFVEPHYHELPNQWEMFIVIHGVIRVCQYQANGHLASEVFVGDSQSSKVVEFQPGDIHSVECISETALMLEVKEGPFNPEYAKVPFEIK
ncbi:WbuC family cupin fold metalloprotein [Vibrio mytili]|uniref:WbuC n=1 Tax=Vibrio mytili TaxID=50718 RepID=A0A0C3DFL3_9VIBR|nr:WbuC family cupin fold metalloprotein [Vibrio mytili]KIN10134.1 WbuC [Vibrio mytili]